MKQGFARVASVAPRVNVADVVFNIAQIVETAESLSKEDVDLAIFPEMSLTGYTCGDLFLSTTLVGAAGIGLSKIVEASIKYNIDLVVGLPVCLDNSLYNCAAVVRGEQVDLIPKTYIPNYSEFYEQRWWHGVGAACEPKTVAVGDITATFHSRPAVIDCRGIKLGVEICEDLWTPIPPSSRLALSGATVIANLSASDDIIGKYDYLTNLISQQSARCIAAYIYAGAGFGESSTDLVFDGKTIIAENGRILDASPRWTDGPDITIADIDIEALAADRRRITTFTDCARHELNNVDIDICNDNRIRKEQYHEPLKYRYVDPRPFVPANDAAIDSRCSEITNIQVAGLARRLSFINCKTLVVGISGGLDSTLALLVAVSAFDRLGLDRKGIIGVTMPGFGTTDRTHDNAIALMNALGVTAEEISIAPAVSQHFKDIGQNPDNHDVTYENSQARYRTMLLMDLANRLGGIVLGTGDLSELALGWATYNGDHISMYGVNAGVPKTLVRYLVRHFARRCENPEMSSTLYDIIDTPISPELIPAEPDGTIKQKTEDLVGPYELHDFYLYYMLRYGFEPCRVYNLAVKAFNDQFDKDTILKWMKVFYRRFFSQQFKRSCMPDGPKVGSVCLSPRGDWRMPSDATAALWLKSLDNIQYPV